MILQHNAEGKLVKVLDNPIPLHAGTLISAYLAKNMDDTEFAEQYFYSPQLFPNAVAKYSLDGVYGTKTRNLSGIRGALAKLIIDV